MKVKFLKLMLNEHVIVMINQNRVSNICKFSEFIFLELILFIIITQSAIVDFGLQAKLSKYLKQQNL